MPTKGKPIIIGHSAFGMLAATISIIVGMLIIIAALAGKL